MSLQKSVNISSDPFFEGSIFAPTFATTCYGAVAGAGGVTAGKAVFANKTIGNLLSVSNIGTAGTSIFSGVAVRSQTSSMIVFNSQSSMVIPAGENVQVLQMGSVVVKTTNATPVVGDFVFAVLANGNFTTQNTTTAIAGAILTNYRVYEVVTVSVAGVSTVLAVISNDRSLVIA